MAEKGLKIPKMLQCLINKNIMHVRYVRQRHVFMIFPSLTSKLLKYNCRINQNKLVTWQERYETAQNDLKLIKSTRYV